MDLWPLSMRALPSSVTQLYLAFSGGLDSTVLLHRLLEYRHQYRIILWHINHGLQDNADAMEAFARSQANQYQLGIRVDKVNLDVDSGNIEAQARRQRYQMFSSVLTEQDALLTAHHVNDQSETLLLNMMRGSGPAGLRAIAAQKRLGQGILLRPLLDVTREQIHRYAEMQGLQWIEDPSNASLCFDRNYLRHQVLPVLLKRWPAAVQQLHRVCEWQNENHALLNDLAEIDYQSSYCQRPHSDYVCLSLCAMNHLSDARKKNLLRYWLKQHDKPLIGYKKLAQLIAQLQGRPDALPSIPGDGYTIRRFRGELYLVDKLPDVKLQPSYDVPTSGALNIAELGFRQTRASLLEAFDREDHGQTVQVRFRLDANVEPSHAHRLKRLFQRYRIPPWKRSSIPLVVIDGDLAGLHLL